MADTYVVKYTDQDGTEVEEVFETQEAADIFAAGVEILLGGEDDEDEAEPDADPDDDDEDEATPTRSAAPSRSAERSAKPRTREAYERSIRSHMSYAHRAMKNGIG